MNKIHRTIWNAALGSWIVVQENARARGPGGRSGARSRGRLAAGALAVAAAWGGGTHDVRADVENGIGTIVIAESACKNSTIGGSGLNYWAQGCNAFASNTDAIAIGTSSSANGVSAIALGSNSYAVTGSIALGSQTLSNGVNAAAVGANATASGASSVALGYLAMASSQSAIALGLSARAASQNSIALGQSATARGVQSVALGANATASGLSSAALGYFAAANGQNTIALGASANTLADNAIAVGQFAQGMSIGSIAIGELATAQGTNSIALGYVTSTGTSGAVDGNIAVGKNAAINNTGSGAIAIGRGAYIAGTLGNNDVTGASTLVVGDNAYAYGNNATVVGAGATATNTGNVAFGSSATASGSSGASAFGTSATASGTGGSAMGAQAFASANNATAIGYGATAATENSVALGNGATTADAVSTPNGVIGGQTYDYAGVEPTGVVSVGAAGAERQVTNVAAGQVNASSTDAVNGSQLNATNTQVTANSSAVTTLQGEIANAVMYDSTAHDLVTLGAVGTNVKLTNVAAGTLSDASTDAVNGSQLYATNSNVTAVSNTVNRITSGGGIMYFHANSSYGDSLAIGANSIAIGPRSVASYAGDIAIGNESSASRASSQGQSANIALGEWATAQGFRSIAIGYGAQVNIGTLYEGASDIAIGQSTYAEGLNSVALGNNANAGVAGVDGNNVAVGSNSVARESGAVVLGGSATAGATNATALGATAYAGASGSTAIGNASKAGASNSVAIGNGANASVADSVALGGGATTAAAAVSTSGGEIGGQTFTYAGANPIGVVSVGSSGAERQVTNVAAGQVNASSTDAVNGSQLNATNTQVTTNASAVTTLQGEIANAVMYDSTAHDSVTLGGVGSTTPVALHNVANGAVAASSFDAINGSQLYTLASSTASGLGGGSTVNGDGSITSPTYAIGGATFNDAGDAFTNLDGRTTANTDAISTLQGQTVDAVTYDTSVHDSVTLGGVGSTTPVAVHNVAAGAVSDASNDAVNGSQLYTLASGTASALGGGSTVNSDGSITSPTYTIGGATFNNAGDAFTNLDGRTTANTDAITNLQGQTADAVMYDTSVHDSVTLGGVGSTTPVALHNVAPGTLSEASTDAVNGSQLYATNTRVTANTNAITNLQGQTADAVMYDTSVHDSVTLGGLGSTTPVALHNVANGAVAASSFDAINGSQLYTLASGTASALGGGSTVNSNGSITSPTYTIGGATFNNAGDAFTNLDGRTTANTDAITALQGQTADAVMYDTPVHDSVTLGGVGSTTPVALHNVANGAVAASSFDAINGSQLYTLASGTASGLGGGSTVNGDGSITSPTYTIGGATFNNAGDAFTNLDGRTTSNTDAISTLQGQTADAVMYDTSVHDSVTLGGLGSTTPVALHNVANGAVAASSFDAINGSQLYTLASSTASSLGGGSTVNGDGSITPPTYTIGGAMFNNAGDAFTNLDGRTTSNTDAISTLQGQTADAVMYDTSVHDSVTLGGVGSTTPVALHNVAAGAVSEASNDAINGSQLYTLASNTASGLGGGSTVNSDGSITSPTYNIGGTTFNNAGDAFTNIDGRVNDLADDLGNGTIGLVQQDPASRAITVAKNTDGAVVDFTGTEGTRVLTGVSPGMLSDTSADAVNGSQLYATNTRVTANTNAITTLQGQTADAVMYDTPVHDSVTLGGVGSTTPVALRNVAAGTVSEVSNDAVNGSQLYTLASGTASALGGGSTVNSDGSITSPTYNIGGATFNNAGDAFTNIDGRTTANTDAISTLQGQTADAVTYDTPVHDSVTLGGVGSTTPVALHNVAPGTLSEASTDAVNGSQLYATNTRVTANTNAITNLQGQTADAVMYDTSMHDSVTLGGVGSTTPVALHNVANGAVAASSFDAINGSQLFGVSSAFVNALGGGASLSADGSITLPTYRIGNMTYNNVGGALTNLDGRVTDIADGIGNGTIGLVQQDATTHAITVGKDVPGISVDFAGTNGVRLLTGVAPGNVDASSFDAVNGSQLFSIGNSTANALGGGATMNVNGTMSGPNYAIGGNTYNNVGGALTDLDGRVSQNAQDISDIKGDVANAVTYDSSAHDSVTLGDGSNPVSLHNVAAGTAETDAVNLGQMNDAIASVQQAVDAAANPFIAAQGNPDTEGAVARGTHATAAGANAVASGANSVALGANTQATGANSVALGADSVADRDNAVSVGSAGNERQITNVAPGTAGTDAANMNQLNAMAAQGQGYVDQRIAGVQNQINDARRDAFGAAAAAMAVAGLPQPTEPGMTMVAAAGSHIGGQTGMALGVSYVTRNNRWIAKASASSSSQGNTGVTLGAGYQW